MNLSDLTLLYLGLSGILLAGCGSPPHAGVSHFSVLTPLHLRAVELAANSNRNQLTHLDRYFESSPAAYDTNRLRADKFLDDYQFATAARQNTSLDLLLKVIAAGKMGTDSDGGGTNDSGSDNKAGQSNVFHSALMAAVNAQTNLALTDSPFDMLDRVSDFYAAHLLKFLRLQGDSRSLDASSLVVPLQQALAKSGWSNSLPASLPSHRLLLLLVQSHVDPGTRANTMTGVRVRLTDPSGKPVPVLRLHPSRTYDLDSVVFADQRQVKVELKGEGQATRTITLSGRKKATSEEEMLRRFSSRLSKVSSYADASEGILGWNFYPSNLRLEPRNAVAIFFSYLIGSPRPRTVRASLEGGGRDCFAVVLVPWNATHLKAKVQSTYAAVRLEGHGYRGETHGADLWSKCYEIALPPASPWEALAGMPGLTNESAVTPHGLTGQSAPASKPDGGVLPTGVKPERE